MSDFTALALQPIRAERRSLPGYAAALVVICWAEVSGWTTVGLAPEAPACRPIVARIEQPGRYCLSSDATFPEGLTIAGDDIELDLGGHCLRGQDDAANRATGIAIAAGVRRVSIHGGCVTRYMIGVAAEKGASDIKISGLLIEDSRFRGALMEADAVTFTGNVVNKVQGTRVYENASPMGLDLRGDNCRAHANLIGDVLPPASGFGWYRRRWNRMHSQRERHRQSNPTRLGTDLRHHAGVSRTA